MPIELKELIHLLNERMAEARHVEIMCRHEKNTSFCRGVIHGLQMAKNVLLTLCQESDSVPRSLPVETSVPLTEGEFNAPETRNQNVPQLR